MVKNTGEDVSSSTPIHITTLVEHLPVRVRLRLGHVRSGKYRPNAPSRRALDVQVDRIQTNAVGGGEKQHFSVVGILDT